ncbi:MAG TPA: hypothetical protein IGS52_21905 [Oscillatoriaceae cyanobacterium M33_DOE_052]|uniref:Uncharacterized protein n=1 Tax=Planktothricoides sp. SpSt-374 TaxID=2282167 RepID=A0A7C3VQL5_9CYAN|nr:hypothetical protein [Oscillatoriaceae cyanobacterium M33_DOE_052]
MINIYRIFRLILLAFTLYNAIQLAINLIRYKPYYDQIPPTLKKYLLNQGGKLLGTKFKEHQQDFAINGILLAVLLCLNCLEFLI